MPRNHSRSGRWASGGQPSRVKPPREGFPREEGWILGRKPGAQAGKRELVGLMALDVRQQKSHSPQGQGHRAASKGDRLEGGGKGALTQLLPTVRRPPTRSSSQHVGKAAGEC